MTEHGEGAGRWVVRETLPLESGWRVVIAFASVREDDTPFVDVQVRRALGLVRYQNGEWQWLFVAPHETTPMTEHDIYDAFGETIFMERVLEPGQEITEAELLEIASERNGGCK